MLSLLSLAVLVATTTAAPTNVPPCLLVSHTPPSITTGCLRASYRGSYGGLATTQDHIYFPTTECLTAETTLDELDAGSVVSLPERDGRIIWVGQAGVDPSLSAVGRAAEGMVDSWDTINERASSMLSLNSPPQKVYGSSILHHTEPISLLHLSASSMLLFVPTSFLPIIDTLLPSHLVPVALPPTSSVTFPSVPAHLAHNLANITVALRFSPQLDRIVTDGIKHDEIRRNVRWLTGEAPSGIESRHSFTPGALTAAHWIKCTPQRY